MKKIIVIFICIISLICITGCNNEKFSKDSVIVTIKSEYKDEFINKEFTCEEFNFENIKKIEYGVWNETSNKGVIIIYLKKSGKLYINSAIKHFTNLDFVENADKNYIVSIN